MKNKTKDIFISLTALLISMLAIITLWQSNLALTIALLVIFLCMHYFWRAHRDTVAFVVGALGGPLAEIIAIHFNVWHYTNPVIIAGHIPLWLPIAWGIAAMLIHRGVMMANK